MANDLLHALIRANLAGGAAALILLATRTALRKLIGPNAVYALWLALPAAGMASLLPPRTVVTVLRDAGLGGAAGASAAHFPSPDTGPDWTIVLVGLWLAGMAASVLWLAWRQFRFLKAIGHLEARDDILQAQPSNAGPAVVGLIRPRILIPGDFEARFNAKEREVILAHERVHLARGDSRINAVVLALRCLNWFNPLVYIAARALRLDQELACDATVMARHPKTRRSYAEAMLKSQVDSIALPVGCCWQAKGASALSRRLALLSAAPLSRARLMSGLVVAALITSGAGIAAWSAQPVRQRIIIEPAAQTATAVHERSAVAEPQQPAPKAARLLRTVTARPRVQPAAEPTPRKPPPQVSSPERGIEWGMPMPPDPNETISDHLWAPADSAGGSQGANGGYQAQTVSTYRNGDYQMKSDFTPVGDKVQVSAQLYKSGAMIGSGTATTLAGETAYVALNNGQVAEVAPGKTAYLITLARPAGMTPPSPS